MFGAIVSLITLPYVDLGRSKGFQFRPLSKLIFWVFVADFLVLMKLGACHVESPFIELGQCCTMLYFSYFLLLLSLVSVLENTLRDLYPLLMVIAIQLSLLMFPVITLHKSDALVQLGD